MPVTLLHFDPGHGASGDMVLGALLDLGVPQEVVDKAVRAVGVDARLDVLDEKRHGVRGLKARFVTAAGQPVDPLETGATGTDVPPLIVRIVDKKAWSPLGSKAELKAKDHGHHHHHPWSTISQRIRKSRLPVDVRDMAHAILLKLAVAESLVHGMPLEEVAFHEVATADSLGDMVGAAAAICHLKPSRITCDAFGVCGGSIRMEHGVLPGPGPATGLILRGAPIVGLTGRMETVTPTGAAILTTVAHEFGPPPMMTLLAQGHGLGFKDPPERANLLRAWLGESGRKGARVPVTDAVLLETNLDDTTPQLMAAAVDRCLEEGALDAWITPVVMKKGRPGWTLSVLVTAEIRAAITRLLLTETTTLGLRITPVERAIAQRTAVDVKTRAGRVRMKVALVDGQPVHASPEHDDVLKLARQGRRSPLEVYGEALAAYQAQQKPAPRRRRKT